MSKVLIYCDGSAHEGKGGAAAVLIGRSTYKELALPFSAEAEAPSPLGSSVRLTTSVTNQTMELWAALLGLSHVRGRGHTLRVVSDSAYVINCFNQKWIDNWRRKGWRKSGGGEVAHRGLWESLEELASRHSVEWVHMRGHSRGTESNLMKHYNERCDTLASIARRDQRAHVKKGRK